jgi:hypothetical protein
MPFCNEKAALEFADSSPQEGNIFVATHSNDEAIGCKSRGRYSSSTHREAF